MRAACGSFLTDLGQGVKPLGIGEVFPGLVLGLDRTTNCMTLTLCSRKEDGSVKGMGLS